MNLHIMYDEKFINSFIDKYLSTHINTEDIFLVISQKKAKKNIHATHQKIVTIAYSRNKFKKIINNKNIKSVYFHNFPPNIYSMFCMIPTNIIINWIFYGYEIYQTPLTLKILDLNSLILYPKIFKEKLFILKIFPDKLILQLLFISEKIKFNKLKMVLKRIDFFYHWNELDYYHIKKIYKEFNAKFVHFCYNQKLELKTFETKNTINVIYKRKSEPLILVGNNSSITLNHLSILKYFHNFQDNNFKIICPLSYGDQAYKKILTSYGKKLLSEKFITLDNFLNYKEYYSFISSIDIVIMNNIRTQGATNIHIALSEGKKLFMNPLNTHYKMLLHFGFMVFSIGDFHKLSFQEIIHPLDLEFMKINHEKAIEFEKKANLWYSFMQ